MRESDSGSRPWEIRYASTPSLTSVPKMCPAAQTSAVRQLPRTLLAPSKATAISAGHATEDPEGMNADATRHPAGSCRRLTILVLAHDCNARRPLGGRQT